VVSQPVFQIQTKGLKTIKKTMQYKKRQNLRSNKPRLPKTADRNRYHREND